MSEALLLVAEGYEQIAAGIRKMIAAQKDTSKKEEKPVKKAEKKETPVADTPKDEAAPKETAVDRKTVRAFLADKSRSGKTSEVKNHRPAKDDWNAHHHYCWRSSSQMKSHPLQQRELPDMRWQSISSISI